MQTNTHGLTSQKMAACDQAGGFVRDDETTVRAGCMGQPDQQEGGGGGGWGGTDTVRIRGDQAGLGGNHEPYQCYVRPGSWGRQDSRQKQGDETVSLPRGAP